MTDRWNEHVSRPVGGGVALAFAMAVSAGLAGCASSADNDTPQVLGHPDEGRQQLVSTGASASSAQPSPSPSQPSDTGNPTSGTAGVVHDRLQNADYALATQLSSQYKATYHHVAVDDAKRMVVVYRKPDPALDRVATALASAEGVTVTFVDTRFTAVDTDAAVARVNADIGYWHARGIELTGTSSSDGTTSAAAASTSDTDPAAVTRLFDQRYGAGVVAVEKDGFQPS